MSENWYIKNSGRIATFLLGLIIVAIVGYFSGRLAISKEMSELRTRISVLEANAENVIKPKFETIDSNKSKLDALVRRVDSMKDEDALYQGTWELLRQFREKEQRRTIQELKELLDEY